MPKIFWHYTRGYIKEIITDMKKNVLVFPAGTEIGLEINNALKYTKFYNVIGASSMEDHSYWVYRNMSESLPFITESTSEEFIGKLNKIIVKEDIAYIYPASDIAQYMLLCYENELLAKVISAPLETVQICRDKKKTYEFFAGEDFIPGIISDIVNAEFPIFIKPCIGNASIGAKIVNTPEEYAIEKKRNCDILAMEYLSGEEYTVDCFTSRDGRLECAEIRGRERIKSGISVHSTNYKMDDAVFAIAEKINLKLKMKGAWFFQLRRDKNGKYKLLEVEPRIAGTMGLTRNKGINFPLLTLYLFDNVSTSIINNENEICVDRALISRYSNKIIYDTIYLDFDDTLVIDRKVNAYLVMFIYQAFNNGKRIILLSKHREEIEKSLEKYRICKSLFDEIIIINQEAEKSDYISNRNAIFVDDSFSERNKVKQRCNIPVFDLDMIESLIDWRCL